MVFKACKVLLRVHLQQSLAFSRMEIASLLLMAFEAEAAQMLCKLEKT